VCKLEEVLFTAYRPGRCRGRSCLMLHPHNHIETKHLGILPVGTHISSLQYAFLFLQNSCRAKGPKLARNQLLQTTICECGTVGDPDGGNQQYDRGELRRDYLWSPVFEVAIVCGGHRALSNVSVRRNGRGSADGRATSAQLQRRGTRCTHRNSALDCAEVDGRTLCNEATSASRHRVFGCLS
jgi:hypothetical protein